MSERSLFESELDQPLAARMRPRTLDEFIGQGHILAPGRLLRRAIQADQLSSLIFYGPPGTGKTTLARVIANSTRAHFTALNAVLSGVKDIREAVKEAGDRQRMGRRTILFVDEVHRFNKAQQDALLPWVENGTVILIGATTENPYFEVNKALVSRSRIFQLEPLDAEDLRRVAYQALSNEERGYGRLQVEIDEDALEHLVNVANGDARALLNALELAVTTTVPDDEGIVVITREVAEESIQRRAVLYDKEGDAHFDTISAFIKSLRGSDPDAALYWMGKMVYAGEDPRFMFRRMIVFASEDVGLADPQALAVTMAAAQAFDYVGMPEGRFHLSQAALYLATAPKSNSTMGFFDALAAVQQEREAEVPNHLRDANRDSEGFGHGEGYLYPHAYRDHWVAQQYLPEALQGKLFYRPSEQGFERRIRDEVARRREAQLAAMLEQEFSAPPEVLTGGPVDRARDRWLQRTVSQAGARLAEIRERVFDLARIQRHQLVLDLDAGSGLFTWEAVRRAPEGQVWSLVGTPEEAEALEQQALALPELERPVVLSGDLATLRERLENGEAEPVRFDVIIGRGLLGDAEDARAVADELRLLSREGGRLVAAEPFPANGQRLYELVSHEGLDEEVVERWRQAEEEIYRDSRDTRFKWQPETAVAALEQSGFGVVRTHLHSAQVGRRVTPEMVDGWFPAKPGGSSYAGRLAKRLSKEELAEVERRLRRLEGSLVSWRVASAIIEAA
ncbi:MAG TPA: AAA family ATPase [Trueperaceae bacterium]